MKSKIPASVLEVSKKVEDITQILSSREYRIAFLMSGIEAQKQLALKQTPSKAPDIELSYIRNMLLRGDGKDLFELAMNIELKAIYEGDLTIFKTLVERSPSLFLHTAKWAVDNSWPHRLDVFHHLHDHLLELSAGKKSVMSVKKELRHDIRALFINNINLPTPTRDFLQSRIELLFEYKKPQYPDLVKAYLAAQSPEYIETCKWLVKTYSKKWISKHGFYVHFLDNPSIEDLASAYAHPHFDSSYLDPRLKTMYPTIEEDIQVAMDLSGIEESDRKYHSTRQWLIIGYLSDRTSLDASAFVPGLNM